MVLGAFVFVILLLAVELGHRATTYSAASATEVHREQVKATRDTLGVLLSLLLGFTLAMALIMLFLISMLTCMTVGYSAGLRFWIVWIVSPLMISIVMWLIADLNSPRSRMIRTDISSMLRFQHDLNQGSTSPPHASK